MMRSGTAMFSLLDIQYSLSTRSKSPMARDPPNLPALEKPRICSPPSARARTAS
jgi:hypothetical protein